MTDKNVEKIVSEVIRETKPVKGEKIYKLREEHLTQLFTLADKLSKKRPRAKKEWTEEERAINKQRWINSGRNENIARDKENKNKRMSKSQILTFKESDFGLC